MLTSPIQGFKECCNHPCLLASVSALTTHPCQYQQCGQRMPRLSSPICASRLGQCNIVTQCHLPVTQQLLLQLLPPDQQMNLPHIVWVLFKLPFPLGLAVRPYENPPGRDSISYSIFGPSPQNQSHWFPKPDTLVLIFLV